LIEITRWNVTAQRRQHCAEHLVQRRIVQRRLSTRLADEGLVGRKGDVLEHGRRVHESSVHDEALSRLRIIESQKEYLAPSTPGRTERRKSSLGDFGGPGVLASLR